MEPPEDVSATLWPWVLGEGRGEPASPVWGRESLGQAGKTTPVKPAIFDNHLLQSHLLSIGQGKKVRAWVRGGNLLPQKLPPPLLSVLVNAYVDQLVFQPYYTK